jgi:hypothetical protein
MRYTVAELLEAMRIEDNPDALLHFAFLLIVIILFITISVVVKNYSKIRTFIVDKNLYNFIIDFKGITKEEKKILDKIIGKNRLKKKYEILILEGIYDKYVEREIVHIKMEFISEEEKIEKILNYRNLKDKLFGAIYQEERE